jgi:hypothetical protein
MGRSQLVGFRVSSLILTGRLFSEEDAGGPSLRGHLRGAVCLGEAIDFMETPSACSAGHAP